MAAAMPGGDAAPEQSGGYDEPSSSCCSESIREPSMKISVSSMPSGSLRLDLDGYAVGGLAVGETHEEMYHILDEDRTLSPGEQANLSYGRGYPG